MAVWKTSPGGYALSQESWETVLGFFLGCLMAAEENKETTVRAAFDAKGRCATEGAKQKSFLLEKGPGQEKVNLRKSEISKVVNFRLLKLNFISLVWKSGRTNFNNKFVVKMSDYYFNENLSI